MTFKNIYNFKDFDGKRIILEEAQLALSIDHTKDLLSYFRKLEKRLFVKDLNLNFYKDNKPMFKIKKIYFSNYGYKKYKIRGQMFGKKFKAHLKNDNKKLHFKILNTGIKADLKFKNRSSLDFISGSSNVKFLNNYLKFDFNFDNNNIEIIKSNFKNKNLSVSFDSLITFNPFFRIKLITNINEINSKLIDGISLRKILSNKEIIKKLSIENTTNYSSKKYLNSLIKNYSSESSLTYGRLIFLNKIFILGGYISCKGDSLLTEEYPRLNFFCKFNINDQKKLFKKFSISKKITTDQINLDIKGSLNLFNKKINFEKINIGKNYVSNEADTKYFKDNFESILFNDGFFGIFKMHKLKEFLLAVI